VSQQDKAAICKRKRLAICAAAQHWGIIHCKVAYVTRIEIEIDRFGKYEALARRQNDREETVPYLEEWRQRLAVA
jgi:hypothetical protein